MMNRLILVLVAAMFTLPGNTFAQDTFHRIGRLWADDGRWQYPGGRNESETTPNIEHRVGNSGVTFVPLLTTFNVPSFIQADGGAPAGTTFSKWSNDGDDDLADITRSFFIGGGEQFSPSRWSVATPTVIQDGIDLRRGLYTIFPQFQGEVRSELRSGGTGVDLMLEDQVAYASGLMKTTKTYSWQHAEADEIIFEIHTITYPTTPIVPNLSAGERGSAPSPETAQLNPVYKDLYIGLNWFQQNGGSGPAGGEHITITPGDGSRYFEAGLAAVGILDELNFYDDTDKIVWSRDGDASDRAGYRSDGDDRGEPAPGPGDALDSAREARIGPGEFLEAEYKGRVFLHVDKTPVSDPNQLSDNWLDPANESDPELQQPRLVKWITGENWIDTGANERPIVYDFYVQPGTTREDRIAQSDDVNSNPSRQIYQWIASFGPYDLALGESIHIVTAAIVNGPHEKMNKEMGLKWLNNEISFAEKEAFLDSGEDSMRASIAVARQAWADREILAQSGITPSLTLAPPWPDRFEVASGPERNEMSWSAVSEAVSYNIYRFVGFETFVDDPPVPLANVTGTSYTDADVIRGTRYFYSVTSVGSDGKESSLFVTRTENAGVSPFAGPSNDLTKIRIVPNPFQIQGGDLGSGGFNFTGQPNKLLFVNLPPQAIIRIFTVTGDLVTRIDHISGSGDEEWELMINDNNQFIASGIYFAHITDPSTGATDIEKFVVVR